ncbi:cob(II)yrinic acid a,c-diamide reductase [Marininema mesophilum]|uniref:Cob(II)yrinic acid a,c-diamide reductase n=1 Tax=Marininema mesophilum TaxID=1048340 RepID=A0A1H2UH49_9BACL|nr:5,6-dimethylbenzimidazole synthase [Marininema mesophilum]SDW55238.1 cob(II)yrinic acid a,c-diamide reductase [Marininema mesophilum]
MTSFNTNERDVLHRILRARRDIRHFRHDSVPEEVLTRMLEAAHYAPSVGFKQPWNYILIRSLDVRRRIKSLFEEANQEELAKLSGDERSDLYKSLKLEGIMEAPLNLAVTCDRDRDAPFHLGQGQMPEMDLYSTCLAVQNLWLAARVEGVGVGWVSIIDPEKTAKILELPNHIQLVAYLCVGYPIEFKDRPMLEEAGWKSRLSLSNLVFEDRWGHSPK